MVTKTFPWIGAVVIAIAGLLPITGCKTASNNGAQSATKDVAVGNNGTFTNYYINDLDQVRQQQCPVLYSVAGQSNPSIRNLCSSFGTPINADTFFSKLEAQYRKNFLGGAALSANQKELLTNLRNAMANPNGTSFIDKNNSLIERDLGRFLSLFPSLLNGGSGGTTGTVNGNKMTLTVMFPYGFSSTGINIVPPSQIMQYTVNRAPGCLATPMSLLINNRTYATGAGNGDTYTFSAPVASSDLTASTITILWSSPVNQQCQFTVALTPMAVPQGLPGTLPPPVPQGLPPTNYPDPVPQGLPGAFPDGQ